jgi:demethylmenaquinone methyltransferase / 2-methoxy-6-polyprenyl-1,4-benzoquinol methylase
VRHTPVIVTAVLPSQADKPRFVAAMFGRIARRYDLMNTVMTAGQDRAWRRVVAEVALAAGYAQPAVLDVGTGTGKLAQAILKAAPAARVVGIDFTESMLRMAPIGLRLAAADALQLPFPNAQFDAIVSAFVIRNLADVPAAIAEQIRVLKPGARLVVLETTPGPPNLLRPFYRFYFRRLVPLLGRLIAGDPSAYTYLPESTLAFLEPSRLADVLRQTGLIDVRVRPLALGSVAVTSARLPVMLFNTGGAP